MARDVDLFVIGGGSGGVRAARIAAGLGAKVAVCEDRYWGGTCVNVGCVPKKLFSYGAGFSADFTAAARFGWDVEVKGLDWSTLIGNKDAEISRLNGIYGRMLEGAGCEVINGRGRIEGPNKVSVGGEHYRAEHILVATGGWPFVPDIPGAELAITSNEVFSLPKRPERLAIVGSGYIGVELAGIFRGFGSQVHLITRGELPLRGFDEDLRVALNMELAHQGVQHHTGASLSRIEEAADGRVLHFEDGSSHTVDVVLFATGRRPNTAGLGLGNVGVLCDAMGGIKVDETWHSSVPSILAVGDVTNRVQLTPVALEEGMQLARNLFGEGPERSIDYRNIPSAVFSQPPIGTVGLSEEEAREMYGDITVYSSTFTPMKLTMGERGPSRVRMKLIVDRRSDVVVGVHMIGPHAGEIIQGFAVALVCGATKAQFDATVGIHPTAAEEFVTMRTPRA